MCICIEICILMYVYKTYISMYIYVGMRVHIHTYERRVRSLHRHIFEIPPHTVYRIIFVHLSMVEFSVVA